MKKMGVFTDNIQALNRGFVSERAEKKAEQEKRKKLLQKQNDYKNYLYKKFYAQFYANQKNTRSDPVNIFGKFQNFEQMQKIVNHDNFTELEIFFRLENYNKILNKVYKQFKNDYDLNISTEKVEKEEERERQKLLKELEKAKKEEERKRQRLLNELQKAIKRRDKAKARYEKSLVKYQAQKLNIAKITKKGFKQIALGIFIGGRVASKTYKKMKY